MAKLKYNEGLVNSTIDELGAASSQLVNTEDEMRSALTIIANAQGIHHVNTDTLFNTLGYPAACQEMIEDTITSIKNRASEIEAYNEEYENASFLEKLGSTAGLFLTKICEGFASAGEQIVDGFASIIGLGAGLISKDAQNSIGEFIKKDHVGDYFDNLYDTSLKSMVIKSWASETGLACNIFKGIGTGLGYATALATTGAIAGGLSTGTMVGAKACAATLMSSLPASATVAGIAGIGAGTQAGLKGGLEYGDAFCYGIKYGAIQAGTTIAFSLAFKALSKGWQMLKTKMQGTANSTGLSVVNDGGASSAGAASGTGSASGASASGSAAAAPKSGITFESYTAGNGKAYTCLDDVWDDVVGGNLSKSQLRDIIKNTVGIDDSGIGHAFMSDALNVMKGKAPSTLGWKAMAEQMAGSADEVSAAAAGNMSGSGSSGMGSVGDDIVNASAGTSGSTGSAAAQDAAEAAAGASGSDAASTAAREQLSSVKRSMDEMGSRLIQKQEALTSAQSALDDAIAAGADDSTVASLQKALDKAQSAYTKQYDSLIAKQQQYIDLTSNGQFDAVGTSKYKLIIGDDVVADANSVAGNITTMRAGTTTADGVVEYRPNWTNASAKAEGQINAREFAQLLDDQYGPVVPTPTQITAIATIGPTAIATIAPTITPGTAIATIGPTAIAPTVTPGPIVTIGPTAIGPTIVPTITIAPTVVPSVVPASGDTIIFGVVEPEEIVPTPSITITPAPVIPVTTTPPITTPPITTPPITTPPITTPPIVVTTPPVVTTTPPVVITTPPPVSITTTPPVVTASPPVVVTTTPPVVTTTPPIDQEYVPIPNTGIGGSSSSRGFGPIPVVAGAAAGIAGVVGGSLLSRMNQKYYDEDEERAKKKEESEE